MSDDSTRKADAPDPKPVHHIVTPQTGGLFGADTRVPMPVKAALWFVLVLLPATGWAQNVANPTQVQFTVSADHVSVTKYSVGFFAAGASTATQEVDLGTGTPAADSTLTFTISVKPLAFATAYTAKVRAWVGTTTSDWSDASNPFDRRPGKVAAPVIK